MKKSELRQLIREESAKLNEVGKMYDENSADQEMTKMKKDLRQKWAIRQPLESPENKKRRKECIEVRDKLIALPHQKEDEKGIQMVVSDFDDWASGYVEDWVYYKR